VTNTVICCIYSLPYILVINENIIRLLNMTIIWVMNTMQTDSNVGVRSMCLKKRLFFSPDALDAYRNNMSWRWPQRAQQ